MKFLNRIKSFISKCRKHIWRQGGRKVTSFLEKKNKNILDNSRNAFLLKNIDKKMLGLEIGPSHNPIAPKKNGYNVKILDHLDTNGLRNKYNGQGVCIENIEDVDYVWKGERLSELIGNDKFDYIIASHVIEHTPDLIGFLKDCQDIMKPDGVLSLAIPDKRFCFDCFRETTSLSKVIDAHISKNTLHSQGTAAEYFLNSVNSKGNIAWKKNFKGKLAFTYTLRETIENMKLISDGHYLDLHAWCFTPASFSLLVNDLNQLGFIKFREVSFRDTITCEFLITLSKQKQSIQINRMDFLLRKR